MQRIVVDLGATNLKAATVKANGELADVRRRPCPPFLSDPPAREINPAAVLDEVRVMIADLGGGPVCSISGQMHNVLLCDEDLNPLTNCISWQDTRCNEYLDELKMRLGDDIIQRTGNEFRSGIPITTLYWLKQKERLLNGDILLSLADWVSLKLHPRAISIHPTMAAATGLWNVAGHCWDFIAYKLAGLERVKLPVVLEGTPVIGDQQAALLGAELRPAELSINVSTGSQVSILSDNADVGDYQVRPYFGKQYLRTVTHIPAGRTFNGLEVLDLKDAFNAAAWHYERAAWRLHAFGLPIVFSGGWGVRSEDLRKAVIGRLGRAFRIAPEEDALVGLSML